MSAPKKPAAGLLHVWGSPDAEGVRACQRTGCTVRLNGAGDAWQRTTGGHWRSIRQQSVQACVGAVS